MGATMDTAKGHLSYTCESPTTCTEDVYDATSVACMGKVWETEALADWKLLSASLDGDLAGISESLQHGAEIETRGAGYVRVRDAPLNAEVGVPSMRAKGMTALMRASKEGHDQAVRLLLEKKACVLASDEDGMQPLHFAAATASMDCCRALIEARASPGAVDDSGRDAFTHLPFDAISRGELQEWRALLRPNGSTGATAGTAAQVFGTRLAETKS